MTKDELEVKLETLQKLLDEQNASANAYRDQIQELQKQLKDINKPKLTGLQLDELYQAIEQGIDSFDFDDQDNYDMDFHIDYDNRIAVESMSFHNAQELVRVVYNEARELFAEADENDNQLNQD
jgi:translation initiation factor 2B subunit (eIF-2B alpha/beta/delta family)